MSSDQIDEARKILENRLSTASLLQINEEKYFLLRDGIPVTVKRPDGKAETRKALAFDFRNPEANHFLAIKELKIHGDLYRRRTDVVGFVNGVPLLFVELKKNSVDVRNAYDDNYTDYRDTIPHLFHYNAFLMLSNGAEAKVGTLGSKYEFFHEWKRLSEAEPGCVALETMLRGICRKENFLDLFENFLLYDHSGGHTAKILARNHQFLGVNEAVKAYADRKLNNGKLGVFWHTQGSGKSYSMVFLAQKIRRTFEGSPTFVVLTDREELNRQISDTFENCGLLGASNAVSGSIEDRKTFSTYASELHRLMKYTDRGDIAGEVRKEADAISAIHAELLKKRSHADITDLAVRINAIIGQYIEMESDLPLARDGGKRFDISAIDFDLLRREFARVGRKNLVLRDLEEAIRQKLDRMLSTNPGRMDYYERYQTIIEAYNSEQNRATIERTFMELMDLARH